MIKQRYSAVITGHGDGAGQADAAGTAGYDQYILRHFEFLTLQIAYLIVWDRRGSKVKETGQMRFQITRSCTMVTPVFQLSLETER